MGRINLNKDMPPEYLIKSDSEDEDYDDKADRASKTTSPRKKAVSKKGGKSTKKGKKTTSQKKPRRRNKAYSDDDDDDISDSNDEDSDIVYGDEEEEEEEEEVEIGKHGRPLRRAVKQKAASYIEEATDDDDVEKDDIESSGDDEKETRGRLAAAKTLPPKGGSRVIKLKYGGRTVATTVASQEPETQPPVPTNRRVTRASSATPSQRPTAGGKGPLTNPGTGPARSKTRQVSAEPSRRSSRLTHTDEPLARLSKSGNAEITNLPQPSIQIPESPAQEHTKPVVDVSVIEELPEPNSSSADISNGNHKDTVDQKATGSQQEGDEQEEVHETPTETVAPRQSPRDDTGHEADEEEDESPSKRTRARSSHRLSTTSPRNTRSAMDVPSSAEKPKQPEGRRLRRAAKSNSRKAASDDEDYNEEGEGDEQSDDSMSSAHASPTKSASKAQDFEDGEDGEYSDTRRSPRKRTRGSASEDVESQAEIAAELEDLQPSPKRLRRGGRRAQFSGGESNTATEPRLRRRTQAIDYRLLRPELGHFNEDVDAGASTPSRRKNGAPLAPARSYWDSNGPFGGGDVVPFFNRGLAAAIDSDSSDDEATRRRGRGGASGFGGTVGMTPSGGHAPGLLAPIGQTHSTDPMQAGAPANLGKITKPGKTALADADPLGVSPDVTFAEVGGLDDRIQQLKEMVMLPLMYPEIFKAKKITPPRGVLFHGPPGTGKTLLARAVASSFTDANGKKVTFYMRKGADCLSKWVGEAERQLRLLFDEARANQPSIIFFDEIDGLAPVRSSKQDQIHASIVSTLLALMDGMDGRGQVVVIGATNRPDSVDPALRRPGRFDREFYFPLPTTEARRSIIDIHTKGWEPPLSDAFKDKLAILTKGYGGADLRALCTESALNAMQRTYPQIYATTEKLKVDPTSVKVTARDFMISLKKMTPSSQRSAASNAAPLPEKIKPLLEKQLESIKSKLQKIFTESKPLTALEEAQYENDLSDSEAGFEREEMMEGEFSRLLFFGEKNC
jgi:SpoVK/Ycf46/Vps4 family AAA+-type ATPase